MKKVLSVLLALCCMAEVSAQEFDAHWISAPQPDSTSHLYFRQTYLMDERPSWMTLRVMTTGYVKVYVNECNVGTASFYPYREANDDSPQTITLDATPYLRPDTNVVAVYFSPAWPHVCDKQVSVSFFGEMPDERPIARFSDGDWLCREAPSRLLPDGGEWMDGRMFDPAWNSTQYSPALWVNAESREGDCRTTPSRGGQDGESWYLSHVRGKKYFDVVGDSVEYEFGEGFVGQVRLTLREAQRGEVLHYGPHYYVCSGELDEQACPVFDIDSYRRVLISGDDSFQREHVFNIEALGMEPRFSFFY